MIKKTFLRNEIILIYHLLKVSENTTDYSNLNVILRELRVNKLC